MQAVRFGLWDPKRLKTYSVAEITGRDLFDKKGVPVSGGLYDLRLGTVSRDHICATCHGDIVTCPGHFGHLDLNVPVFHVLLLKPLIRVLQCVCPHCASLVTPERPSSFPALHASCRSRKTCVACECTLPKYEIVKGTLFRTSVGEESVRVPATDCYVLLSKLTEDAMKAMHLSYHPKHLLITRFPIPPPQTHPPIAYGVRNSFDDLTNKLIDIIRTNQSVADAEESRREAYVDALQMHVSMYLDSDSVPITGRSTRPFKGLSQRLKSKEGRIRGNLNGKRVNFSARTVLTGDATLRLEEVGIPECIARTLTFPIGVTSWNKRGLERLIAEGDAKSLVRANGVTIDLRIAKAPIKLHVGDTIERSLRDGDPIIFNRQPTLHRMSMMCHYARVLPGKTFRINLSATSPYNADCDGDELNVHVPQNYEAWSEMTQLMDVREHVVSSQANRPVIGLVQDTMLAMFRMTDPDTWIPRAQAMQMVMACGWTDRAMPSPAIRVPVPLWTGSQLVSMTLPSLDMDGPLVIREGELLSGRITKKNVGGNGGLVHTVWLTRGSQACGNMITDMQFLAHAFNLWTSFSVGLQDMTYGLEHRTHIDGLIDAQTEESMRLMRTAGQKGLGRDAIEPRVVEALDYARDSAGAYVRDGIPDRNNLKQMVDSGAKGNNINIAQICSCVGLQHIEGKRPESTFDQTRCLSRFKRGEVHPKANGFIRSSYLRGLDPTEFFFHAMAGREGVIDTAIRTSETGYIQREFVKLMEDIKVAYDGTVRDSSDEIIQFAFGGDGLDPTFVQAQTVEGRTRMLPFVLSDVQKRPDAVRSDSHDDPERDPIEWDVIPEPIAAVMRAHDPPTQRVMWSDFRRAQIQPGTSVGIIAAQSLGEVSTQLALNSVTWHTPIVLAIDGSLVRTSIGAFVDKRMALAHEEGCAQVHSNGTEWAPLSSDQRNRVWIESIDENGTARWTRLEGVSRHPVINADGSDTVVRFRMASGRTITVTKAKGMLKKVGTRILGVPSDDVNVDDYVPVAGRFDPFAHGASTIETACDVGSYLRSDPRLSFEHDALSELGYAADAPVLAYEGTARAFRDTFSYDPSPSEASTLVPCFYVHFVDSQTLRNERVPERIPWSYELGFVVAACWVAGRSFSHASSEPHRRTVVLRGTCRKTCRTVRRILRTWGVESHVEALPNEENAKEEWTLTIRSYPWTRFLESLGMERTLSERILPDCLLRVPTDAVRGFWDGYMSWHADVRAGSPCIVPCASKAFVYDAIHMLARLGIETYEFGPCKRRTGTRRTSYEIRLSPYWSAVFWETIPWTHRTLRRHAKTRPRDELLRLQPERIVPEVGWSSTSAPRAYTQDRLVRMHKKWSAQTDRPSSHRVAQKACREIERALNLDCWFDRVVAKEETHPSDEHPLMYDLTVEGTRNFCTASRLVVRDSFHHSGTAGSITSGGVPRLKRLIHASKDLERNVWAPVGSSVDPQEACLRYKRVPIRSLILSIETVPWSDAYADSCWQPLEPTERILKLHCSRVRMHDAGYSVADVCAVITRDMDKCVVWGTHLNAPKVEIYVAIKNKSMLGLFKSELDELTMHRGHDTLHDVREMEGGLWFQNASLLDVFGCEEIVPERAITTSVIEAFEVLGVEAARTVFVTELKRVFESAGTYLNDHHYTLLADVVFQPGRPMPVSRHGVRDTKGVLGKASFETTIDTLFTAATNRSVDRLRGVSERIITGTRIRTGTGSCSVRNTPLPVESDVPSEPTYTYTPSSPTHEPTPTWTPKMEEPRSTVTAWVPV